MIIKCEKCGTRFRIADEKMQPEGIKVRCAKCRAIFRAQPTDAPLAATLAPAAGSMPKTVPQETPPVAVPEPGPAAQGEFADDFAFAAGPRPSDAPTADESFDFDGPDQAPAPEEVEDDFDLGDFDFDRDAAAPAAFEAPVPAAAPVAVDDLEFDSGSLPPEEGTDEFGDFSFSETEDEGSAGDAPRMPAPEEETDAFADFSFAETQEAGSPEDQEEEEFDFSPEDLGAALTEDDEEEEEHQKSAAVFAAGEVADADEEFSFSDTEPPPTPFQGLRPNLSATPAADANRPSSGAAEHLTPAGEKAAEPLILRPAPRKSPVASLMVFLLVLLIVLTAITGYLFWQKGPQAFEQLILGLTGEKAVPPGLQEGIDLRALQSLFVANQEAGELFVIHGQAVNRFTEPRSAIQVKGVVYDAAGKPILQQTVFCGNALSDEQLRTLPYAGIEEAMNNQFGDSLSNLNVRPGQSIAFSIVFRNLPPGMSEFTVEVVDSRPVTADQ